MNGETYIISEVIAPKGKEEWYTISTKEGCGFGLEKKYGVVPKVKDKVTLYSSGSTIRGMDINGKKVFYKSDAQLEWEHKKWCENYKKEQEETFKKQKPKLDKDYKALPQLFKDRIDKFRKNNPEFRVEYESYELFCCTQAVFIAKGCKTPKKVELFSKMNWDEQKRIVPELSEEHSGNTFGSACQLAYWFLKQPEAVKQMHGSLSVLVGSEEYGDVPKKKK